MDLTFLPMPFITQFHLCYRKPEVRTPYDEEEVCVDETKEVVNAVTTEKCTTESEQQCHDVVEQKCETVYSEPQCVEVSDKDLISINEFAD